MMGRALFLLLASVALLALGETAPAFAADTDTTGCDPKGGLSFPSFFGKDGTEKPIMECGYKNNAKASATCDKCKTTVDDWASKLPDAAKKAASSDKDLTCKATTGDAIAKNPAKVDSNLQAFQSQAAVTAAAKATDQSRSSNASDASKQFQQCLTDIDKSCKGAMLSKTDKKGAETMQKACQDAKDTADKFADQKTKDGKSAGSMGDMMDALGKAMQAASQLAQQQQQQQPDQATSPTPDSGATSPTPNSSNGAETSKTDGSGNSSPINGGTVGFTTPKATVTATNSTPGGSVTGFGSTPLSRGLASDFGNSTGASSPGIGNFGSSGGGSGGGIGNSTGASRPGDGSAAPAANPDNANPYEMTGGGGLRGGSNFKAGKGDDAAAALPDAGLSPGADAASKLDALSDKPPADDQAADDVLAHDGESIFLRVRQKYSLLKGAGRI